MRRRSGAGPKRAKSRRRKTMTQKRRGLRNPSAAEHKTQSDIAQLIRERDEALEREEATAQVLRVISSSPGELQAVLDALVRSAMRFCGASDAAILRLEGQQLRVAAHHGPLPYHPLGHADSLTRERLAGRAV